MHVDVAIVGGGVAGAALAGSLAREGRRVLVLEATTEFRDRVRGESMFPWGVREAHNLGVEDVLVGAGAHVSTSIRRYGDGLDQPRVVPLFMMVPGVAGGLNLSHPVACQALLDNAVRSGVQVVRGATDVEVTPGVSPRLTFTSNGHRQSVTADVIVGADGRGSTVRRQIGVALEKQDEIGFITGLRLNNVEVPADHDAIVEDGDRMFLLFHQGNNEARVYVCQPPSGRHRYSGERGSTTLLEDLAAMANNPWREQLATARAAGPCATAAGTDAWTDRPFVDGVVLIGDAAGHNDPTAGCGLSIAMRDARVVRDLILNGARSASAFESYGHERSDRMRRLRLTADVLGVTNIEPATNRGARRAFFDKALDTMSTALFPIVASMFAGPETIPVELVDDAVLDLLRAA